MRGIRRLDIMKFDFLGVGKNPPADFNSIPVIAGSAGQHHGAGRRHVDADERGSAEFLRQLVEAVEYWHHAA